MDYNTRQLIIKHLEQPGVLLRLYDYAYQYDTYKGKRLPRDWTPEDVVNEAIYLLLNGDRNWDQNRFPDLTIALKGMIKSLFYHIPRLKYNKMEVKPVDEDGNSIPIMDLAEGPNETQTDEPHDSELMSQIENAIKDDDELMEVYFAILEGHIKPRAIAKKLGIEVKETNKRLKRLRRICQKNVRKEV